MTKPIIYYDPKGESGNIFYILAMVRSELRKQRRIQDYNDCWERVQNSHSYEEALKVINEYVELRKEDKGAWKHYASRKIITQFYVMVKRGSELANATV